MPRTKLNENGLTDKMEKFVQRYAGHGIEWRAYVEAFNVVNKKAGWVRTEACMLLQKPEVQARLRQLHLMDEQSAIYDHRQCMLEAHEAYVLAKQLNNPVAMVAAAQLRAKVSGLIVDKSASVNVSIGQMTNEELAREHERLNEQLRSLGHPALPALGLSRAGAEGPRTATAESQVLHKERVADH